MKWEENGDRPNPNTALLSAILMFGTFFIAYFLRIFRNSKFLGRNVSNDGNLVWPDLLSL